MQMPHAVPSFKRFMKRSENCHVMTCQHMHKLILLLLTDNDIVGEALIALRHEELKEMNIMSIGHRLTILKGVYDVKIKQGIPIDSYHWIPPCKFSTTHVAVVLD